MQLGRDDVALAMLILLVVAGFSYSSASVLLPTPSAEAVPASVVRDDDVFGLKDVGNVIIAGKGRRRKNR